jgi:uncharacterized LabA/DUF88 family protein
MRTAVFIDGGYMDRVSRSLGSPRIDYGLLVREMAQGDLLRAYYYHCLPYVGVPAAPEDEERRAGKERFFNALSRLPRFQVREGVLQFYGRDEGSERPIYIQKRTDVLLTMDLMNLTLKGRLSRAVLVAGDSDLVPIVQAVKAEGVTVHLFHGEANLMPNRDLWEAADERTVVTHALFHRALATEPGRHAAPA